MLNTASTTEDKELLQFSIMYIRNLETLLNEIFEFDETTCDNIGAKLNYFNTLVLSILNVNNDNMDIKNNYTVFRFDDDNIKTMNFKIF